MKRISILLITATLVVGMVSCGPAPVQNELTISTTSGGSVIEPGEGTFTYDEGAIVDLLAEAEEGYYFVSWIGDVATIANVNNPITNITMQDNYSIDANFEQIPPGQFILTIYSTTGGSVTEPGEGTSTYDAGTVVDLVATPGAGYRFDEWTGDVGTVADVNAATTTITMNGDYSVTAEFVRQYDLTTSSTVGGSVTEPGEGTSTYDAGTVVDLVATPGTGYRFDEWTGDVGTIADVDAATTAITMNGDYSVTAEFVRQYDLTTSSTVGGSVTEPGEGTSTYDAGTVVDLVATPGTGYRFDEWTGDVGTIADVDAATTTITMNGDYSITANFGSVYGNYTDITNHVLCSQGGISYPPKPIVDYPEGHEPAEYYEGPWPTPDALSAWYWEDIKDVAPYGSDTIDLAGADLTLGPLLRDGALQITNSLNPVATLTLTGTLYVTGDTIIAPTNDLIIDLNGHAIFVESDSQYPPMHALYIKGPKLTIRGPGVIVAMGAMYFEPNIEAGMTDPIFIISVYGVLEFKAAGDFYGALAGSIEVELTPGSSVTYPEDGFPADLNWPGFDRGKS